jgi:hypothetical protein
MPASKAEKKKKKKKPLTNAEILKLIKKLKPKNQQIVRVNIGDKGAKSGASGGAAPPIRPYAQQGGVVFTSAYGAPTPSPPPPPPPVPITLPAPAPTTRVARVPSAPLPPAPLKAQPTFDAPKKVAPQQPQRLIQGNPFKTGKLAEKVAKQFGKYSSATRALLEGEEEEEEYSYSTAPSFVQPTYQRTSTLGATSRNEVFSNAPTINDPYFDDGITITENNDQKGTQPNYVPSDAWSLTAEGSAPSLIERIESAVGEGGATTMEETLRKQEEADQAAFEQYQAQLQAQAPTEVVPEAKAEIPPAPREVSPRSRISPFLSTTTEGRLVGKTSMVAELNTAIIRGQFDYAPFVDSLGLSLSNTYQTGKNKGQLRKNLSDNQVNALYEALKASY